MVTLNGSKIVKLMEHYAIIIGNVQVVKGHSEVIFYYSKSSAIVFKYSSVVVGFECSLSSTPILANHSTCVSEEEDDKDDDPNDIIFDNEFDDGRASCSTARGSITDCMIYGDELPRRKRRVATCTIEHDIESEGEDEEELSCSICDQSFTFPGTMRRHVC